MRNNIFGILISVCTLVGIPSLCSAKIKAGTTVTENRYLVTLNNGQQFEYILPSQQEIKLPIKAEGKMTGKKVKLGIKHIKSIEMASTGKPIGGIRRWEVHPIATPSVFLGKHHVNNRLLAVLKQKNGATVYQWTVERSNGDKKEQTIWYGVLPDSAEKVYPFVQDGKVWLRDIKMALGDTHPDFVEAVQNYYVRAAANEAEERRESLRRHPAEILDVK